MLKLIRNNVWFFMTMLKNIITLASIWSYFFNISKVRNWKEENNSWIVWVVQFYRWFACANRHDLIRWPSVTHHDSGPYDLISYFYSIILWWRIKFNYSYSSRFLSMSARIEPLNYALFCECWIDLKLSSFSCLEWLAYQYIEQLLNIIAIHAGFILWISYFYSQISHEKKSLF